MAGASFGIDSLDLEQDLNGMDSDDGNSDGEDGDPQTTISRLMEISEDAKRQRAQDERRENMQLRIAAWKKPKRSVKHVKIYGHNAARTGTEKHN